MSNLIMLFSHFRSHTHTLALFAPMTFRRRRATIFSPLVGSNCPSLTLNFWLPLNSLCYWFVPRLKVVRLSGFC